MIWSLEQASASGTCAASSRARLLASYPEVVFMTHMWEFASSHQEKIKTDGLLGPFLQIHPPPLFSLTLTHLSQALSMQASWKGAVAAQASLDSQCWER